MKKILCLVLVLSMLPVMLSASAEDSRVILHLTRASFNLKESDPEQVKKVENAINGYIADKLNVEVRLNEIGSDEYDKNVLSILDDADTDVNILWTASWESFIGTNDLVARGCLYDITDYLPGTDLYSSIPEDQWMETKYNGRHFFIPVYKDNVEGYDFMYRKDLADRHNWNIRIVQSLEDLEPILADAKADGIKYPFLTQKTAMFYRWCIDHFDFFTADNATNFFAVDRDTNQVVDTILTPEYASFCKLMGRWASLGYISSDEVNKLTLDTTTQTQDWAVSWWTDVPVNSEASARYGQPVIMGSATERYAHSTSALGSCYCILASSSEEQVQAAIDFMGLLFSDRALADIYTFGIEGEDFDYTQTEDQKIPHVTQHSSKYNHSMWESAPATIVSPMHNEPDNKGSLYLDFNGGARVSVACGFRFDKGPVAEKYDACRALFEQYGFVLENGGVPEAEVDARIQEYQAALDDAGYQDVLAEFSRQYEAWKAENPQT